MGKGMEELAEEIRGVGLAVGRVGRLGIGQK